MATPRKPPSRSSGSRPSSRPSPAKTGRPQPSRSGARVAGRSPAPPKRPAGPAPFLSTKQRCYLRGLGHHLEPVVQVGKEGLTDALCQAIEVALSHHQLIKLRLAETVEGERHELAAQLADRCHAALVQVLGRTFLLFRPRPEEKRAKKRALDQRSGATVH